MRYAKARITFQALAAVVAHTHDKVLQDWKVWRSGVAVETKAADTNIQSTDRKPVAAKESSLDPRNVFVVHGRDEQLRKDLFEFLRTLGLIPMEWSEAVRLTGKGSPYIGEILDSAFAHAQAVVVLLTPDDEVRLSPELVLGSDGPDEKEYRLQARPNVLFEAGLGFGRNPDRTILVEVGSPKPFSDVAGRHAVRLSNAESRREDLMDRLKTAGCNVQPKDEHWRTAGNFEVSRAVQSPTSGQVISGASATETEPSVKWVDLNYPRDSGLQERLQAEGYAVRWSLDTELARRLDIDGWTLVTQPEAGREVVFKMKDRPADQTLIKRKLGGGARASLASPTHNLRFIEVKTVQAHRGINDAKIHESQQGQGEFQISVVCFRNEPAVGRTLEQPDIKAHIIYKDSTGKEITDASGAVWLGEYGEETFFESGKKKCLIVFLLDGQGSLLKLWMEEYHTRNSWMAGGPLFRIRDEEISGTIASLEISLLAGGSCMLKVEFQVEQQARGELPKLALR